MIHYSNTTLEKSGAISVAIVHGDKSICQRLAGAMARTQGFDCAGVYYTGKSALVGLSAKKPQAILMGINLPDAPGIVSLGKLKSSLPKTHILMYADSMDADDIWGALAIGATGYFLMGTPIDELLTAIQKLQSGKFITRSEVARKTVNLFRCPVFGQDATRLSERQTKVLDLLVRGYSNRQIAVELKVGVSTVITHVARIFKKLDVHSRAQAVAKFTRNLNLEVADYSRAGLSKPE